LLKNIEKGYGRYDAMYVPTFSYESIALVNGSARRGNRGVAGKRKMD
jgi:hypothetical protein